ncbi:hypothetical protein EHI8A_087080 [Entamoeba histolytica HM-1:IMSS-B]|uniref:Uncharacterized protein n=5 Tax=Entamoeba histolytica TaxID=5759 RepID=C4M7F7_ENTH1|nr:hypothetical protein EHI_035980 [Entamoeba histolytica HM-1:IMSS]EMD48439.1 Hypothetical protein EHI5A_043560 [Entamoeba histolytica KU27]EMH76662.1 hypothetical protein EHI8A_087080 [Entamoeba histolytica HM-1:IMSS-B]ENY63707.1 hypothetical protein EHI7A_025450 [Entamoeba histolytica HM-1:IMSS-A]GAT97468.1 hypothetical protein CL6EHI_035980 [Entamoeba histolytica]EAL43546.1 hypothetical protein EHI_035980 [Entamoeba histolytica HM-1:IMSS]|eukprot:XP_648934.1 hypothetical protein EHI_035980 [Entamoeba histolytica HM-1:IMSS]
MELRDQPIVYFENSRVEEEYPSGTINGFSKEGEMYYRIEGKRIEIYSKESKINKTSIECQSEIISAISIDTGIENGIVIVMENTIGIIKNNGGEVINYYIEGAYKVFKEVKIGKDKNYYYFIVVTKPFSIKLVRISCFGKIGRRIEKKLSIKEMEESNEEATYCEVSYPTFTSKPSYMKGASDSRPYIEVSESGRKPFPNIFYLEEFVPTFISIGRTEKDIIVIVGGNDGLMFGYQVNTPMLIFSIQIASEKHCAIEKIMYSIGKEYQKNYITGILYGGNTTEIYFFGIDERYGLEYKDLMVYENYRFLAGKSHEGRERITTIIVYDKGKKQVMQSIFDSEGRNISNNMTGIEVTEPIGCVEEREYEEEFEEYEKYKAKGKDIYYPSYIEIMGKKEWSSIICTSPGFERIVQCIRLLPCLIFGRGDEECISYYTDSINMGYSLPEYKESATFITEALQILIGTGNIGILIEELEERSEESRVNQVILDFFRIYYEDINKEVKERIMTDDNIDRIFLQEVEEKLAIVKTIFLKINEETNILDRIEQNLYGIRYYLPIIQYVGELRQKEIIEVNGTLITPMINLFMEGSIYPVGIDLMIIHLMNNRIYPSYQLYLNYLFIIHGLNEYIEDIPAFSELPEIPNIARLLVAFDSEEYKYFYDTMRVNVELRESIITDIIPVVFRYYEKVIITKPNKYIDTLVTLIDNIESFHLYIGYLIGRNEFGKAMNSICRFHGRFNSPTEIFLETVKYLFEKIIEKNKLEGYMEVIYNTTWEHYFMTYCLKSESQKDIIGIFNYFLKIEDIYSSSLLYVYLHQYLWINTPIIYQLEQKFQEFVRNRNLNEQCQIQTLLQDQKQLDLFINGDKEISLGMVAREHFDE